MRTNALSRPTRRGTVAAALLGSASLIIRPATADTSTADLRQWAAFRTRFIRPDGRVVDTGNDGVSHSEGQSYAMLLAEALGDRATFQSVLDWSRTALRRTGDELMAWRWRPRGTPAVMDRNNATDGDLVMAWALARAADRWGESRHRELARAIGRDILSKLITQAQGMALLLPGAHGFDKGSHVVVNPSYYVFPALPAVGSLVPDPAWARVASDGLALLRTARFGPRGLSADWVRVDRAAGRLMRPADGWPARFSYDAVRVPLYLTWAGLEAEPACQAAANLWGDPGSGRLPAWADLATGTAPGETASDGVRAVAALVAAATGRRPGPVNLPTVEGARDYYSAALSMLSRLAARERGIPVA